MSFAIAMHALFIPLRVVRTTAARCSTHIPSTCTCRTYRGEFRDCHGGESFIVPQRSRTHTCRSSRQMNRRRDVIGYDVPVKLQRFMSWLRYTVVMEMASSIYNIA